MSKMTTTNRNTTARANRLFNWLAYREIESVKIVNIRTRRARKYSVMDTLDAERVVKILDARVSRGEYMDTMHVFNNSIEIWTWIYPSNPTAFRSNQAGYQGVHDGQFIYLRGGRFHCDYIKGVA